MQYRGPFHDPPRSPAQRRPGDMPYYIENRCVECGHPLVYSHPWDKTLDLLPDGSCVHRALTAADPVWFDTFCCPLHLEGVRYLDWPPEEIAELEKRAKERGHSRPKWRYLRRVGLVDQENVPVKRQPRQRQRRA